MSDVALAFLDMDDGKPRQICVGCTEVLVARGMVEMISESPVSGGVCYVRLYGIRYPFTLEGCRRAIKGRHVGRPWGE